MLVYELTHLFFRYDDELIHCPKNLGFYYSWESIGRAIQYYCTQPGFCENQDAFSVRERNVSGTITGDVVYEVLVYIHSEDYEIETQIELGLYGDENVAQDRLIAYCRNNAPLIGIQNLVVEKIVNKCIVERREWLEGFTVSK